MWELIGTAIVAVLGAWNSHRVGVPNPFGPNAPQPQPALGTPQPAPAPAQPAGPVVTPTGGDILALAEQIGLQLLRARLAGGAIPPALKAAAPVLRQMLDQIDPPAAPK